MAKRSVSLRLPVDYKDTLPPEIADDQKAFPQHVITELDQRLSSLTLAEPMRKMLKAAKRLEHPGNRLLWLRLALPVSLPATFSEDIADLAPCIAQPHAEGLECTSRMMEELAAIEADLAELLEVSSLETLLQIQTDATACVARSLIELNNTTTLELPLLLALLLGVTCAAASAPSGQHALLLELGRSQQHLPANRMIGVPESKGRTIIKNMATEGPRVHRRLSQQAADNLEDLVSQLGYSSNRISVELLVREVSSCKNHLHFVALRQVAIQLVDAIMCAHGYLAEAKLQRQKAQANPGHLPFLMVAAIRAQALKDQAIRILQLVAGAGWFYSAEFLEALEPLRSHTISSLAARKSLTADEQSMADFLRCLRVLPADTSAPDSTRSSMSPIGTP